MRDSPPTSLAEEGGCVFLCFFFSRFIEFIIIIIIFFPITPNNPLRSGRLDVNGQQIDLRTSNSWLLKLEDVSMPELVEVMAINTLAPFLLNSRLQPLLAATAKAGAPLRKEEERNADVGGRGGGATRDDPRAASVKPPGAAFIVNVSAMVGHCVGATDAMARAVDSFCLRSVTYGYVTTLK